MKTRLFWLAIVASVLGVAVWIASGAVIDAGRLKGEVQRDVRRATGREFSITGPLQVTMGLAPTVTARGITLANLAGGSEAAMLTADSVSAQVALLPLLTGRVVVESVTLSGVNILVEPGPDGSLNWQFQPQRHALVPGGEAGGGSRGGGFDLHRLDLQDAHLTWHYAPGRTLAASFQDASVGADSPDSPMNLSATGQAYGVPVVLSARSGSFSRLEGGPVTVLAGTWALDASVAAGPATLKLTGGINHPEEGRGYSFLLTGNAPDLAPLSPWLPSVLALPLHDVNLTARLSDGSNGVFHSSALSLHAGAADLGAAVAGLRMRDILFSAPGPGQQAQLTVDGTYQDAPLRLTGTTTQPDLLSGNAPLPISVSAEIANASLSAHGTVPASLAGNGFDLSVNATAPNLAALSALARRPLPAIQNLQFAAHIGDAGFRLRGLDLREISLQSSMGDLAGNLVVAWAPVLTLNGTLSAKQLDADAALAAWSMLSGPAAAPAPAATPALPAASPGAASGRYFGDTPLPFAALQGADGDLTFSADRMSLGAETYSDVSAKLLAADGRIVVNPLRMTAPQGIVIGGLTIDASAAPPQVALTFRSPGLSAAKVTSALGLAGGATGSLQVDAQLSGFGNSPHDLAASLNGHLGVTLVNGSVSDTLLQSMLGAALSRAGVPPFGGDVPVRCFASRTDFARGVGRVRALSLDTPQMSLGGDGLINLADETVALHVRPSVRVGGTGIAAPVSLTGGFGDLKAALDPVLGGRVGITIGGPAPSDAGCYSLLPLARGGLPGPLPTRASPIPLKKPTDLLRGLFH